MVIRNDESQRYMTEAIDRIDNAVKQGFDSISTRLDNWKCPSKQCLDHEGVLNDHDTRILLVEQELGISGVRDEVAMNTRISGLEAYRNERIISRKTLLWLIGGGIASGSALVTVLFLAVEYFYG
jgi:hypothetical protein